MSASIFLLGKSHGQESLAGYRSWGHKGTESLSARVRTHTCLCMCVFRKIDICPHFIDGDIKSYNG